ncbi:MAG: amino acid permease [Anaerolineae bacterium]|nr:amino acid permease [Anaerolineae bacterium]
MRTITTAQNGRSFGTFIGVFVPTTLTILGAIMYLRLGWVVGNAGLVGAILIILMAHVITVSTGLAVSSMATNIRVGAGGAFSIISQSLGLEVGGAISVPLYLAQAISCTLYIFAFAEGWLRIFPHHWETAVVLLAFGVVFIIAFISARFAARIQLIILVIVAFSLFSIFLGSFPTDQSAGMIYQPTLVGNFPDGDFWYIFSVFFPAVTGIMAGISLSGVLKDPRRSIPLGTMSAIAVTMVIYLFLAYWLSRVASPEELLTNSTVMVDKAYWSWAVLAGLLGATFSSALGSLLAAPRVMQALGSHGVLPYGHIFATETSGGEPRYAMLATGVIVVIATIFALLAGGLNAVAPLITMFFLITYFMLNAVVLIEQTLSMVSFRPTFKVSRIVPFVGAVGCLFVMFLINPIFSLMAMGVSLFVYVFLLRRQLNTPWEDVRSGLFISVARWAVEQVSKMPPSPERTWSPNVLAPVVSTKSLRGNYRFLSALTSPKGSVHIIGVYAVGKQEPVANLNLLARSFLDDGVTAWVSLVEEDDYVNAVDTAMEVLTGNFFRPNMLFMPYESWLGAERERIAWLLKRASDMPHLGILLLCQHPVVGLGQEQVINVWMREQGPDWALGLRLANLDLAVLVGYQVARNWNGRLNLCMVVPTEETSEKADDFLEELKSFARLPAGTGIKVFVGSFWEALPQGPAADLTILGLQAQPDLDFVEKAVKIIDASCIFVRDSGDESALA